MLCPNFWRKAFVLIGFAAAVGSTAVMAADPPAAPPAAPQPAAAAQPAGGKPAAGPPAAAQPAAPAQDEVVVLPEGVTSPAEEAAKAGDINAIKALLAKHAPIDAPSNDGSTALHWAAESNNLDLARQLLKAGANANAATHLGATPLYLAAVNGSPGMIKLLLASHADPNGRVLTNGETALMFAARSGNIDSVRLLLDAHADVNAAESYHNTTALMWAAERDNAAIVKLLLEKGADATAASKVAPRGTTGRARGGSAPDPNLAPPPAADGDGAVSPDAAPKKPPAAAAGADAPARKPPPARARPKAGGVTALVLAARENGIETVKTLLDGGAPINEPSGDGSTALLVAVQNVHLELARLLIERGADVNLANEKGWNPLYLAVKDRSMEVGTMPAPPTIDRDELYKLITVLLDRGANPNARIKADTEMRNAIKATWLNEAGATPFLRASLCGDVQVMKLLMDRGADPKIPTSDNTTALAALAGVGYTKGFMEDLGGTDTSLQAIKMLIDAGIDVNAANKDNVTALHGAAHKNFVGAIQLLVDHGGDLTAVSQRRGTFERSKDFKGNTVLDWAYGVQTGGESAVYHPEAVALVEKLLKERKLPAIRFENTNGGITGQVVAVQ